MANYKLKTFANPQTLKGIDPALLHKFLEPYEKFFEKRGLKLTPDPRQMNYEKLELILMNPDENTPDDLLHALFFIDEMSFPEYFDDLMTEAMESGLKLVLSDNETSADLAMKVWLEDSRILEKMHAEKFLTRPKSFEVFMSTAPKLLDVKYPTNEVLIELEKDLDDFFKENKRGRGTRVLPYSKEDGIWFLVRHGDLYKREGALENGESGSIFYRPEKFDVLNYNPHTGELAINAKNKGEKKAYCQFIGKHIFCNEDCFNNDKLTEKYTLVPLLDDGRSVLNCTDIQDIQYIRLSEIQFRHPSDTFHIEVHKSDDVFTAMDMIQRCIPSNAKLVRASFKIKFADAPRERTVVVRPPNVAIFDRESDAALVSEWMQKRGLIIEKEDADVADEILEVA